MRSQLVGLFLALLELVRQKLVRFEQEGTHGAIYIFPRDPDEEIVPENPERMEEQKEEQMPANEVPDNEVTEQHPEESKTWDEPGEVA
jgi:hypothetical protein